jgi:two-component system chemotaxis sensor kinase CheA
MSEFGQNEQMLEIYLFETLHNIEQLESCILEIEKTESCTENSINEIFRIMHTIKGSSAMMLFNNIANLAHAMEDLFYFIREKKPQFIDTRILSELLLEGIDFLKIELEKIQNQDMQEEDGAGLMASIREFLRDLKQRNASEHLPEEQPAFPEKIQYYIIPDKPLAASSIHYYKATLHYEDGCEMENIRAYSVVHNLRQFTEDIACIPGDIIENPDTIAWIREKGFVVYLRINMAYQEMQDFFEKTIFLDKLELLELPDDSEYAELEREVLSNRAEEEIKLPQTKRMLEARQKDREAAASGTVQSLISVNVAKLDKLMDLMGEMVIAESLVTQNPDLDGLELDDFNKAARQLHKITTELQDIVMSIRMVPLASSFHKMHRLVRDMNKKLDKETELSLVGEETEVDKNIIEHISDPLMHLVRNSIDHGIEDADSRDAAGKSRAGKITLEARNLGSDVMIMVKDDGKGLSKQKLIDKARQRGLLVKQPEEMTEREIFSLIFRPGFSTKDMVSEFSGRGVGMDVVTKNIEAIGGSVNVDSREGLGTTISLKIPLTLAIIDGMNVRVGSARYTIPTMAIRESFRPEAEAIIIDPDGNEMIMVRGNCYPILRLHRIYQVETEIVDFTEGILIMVEQEEKTICIFADELLGQQQVVIKVLPDLIKRVKKIKGISGCTLLGDGNISLIMNMADLIC